jgi:hypothetical protein
LILIALALVDRPHLGAGSVLFNVQEEEKHNNTGSRAAELRYAGQQPDSVERHESGRRKRERTSRIFVMIGRSFGYDYE